MTLLYVGEEPPVELARYELNGKVVKLTMLNPAAHAKAVTEESMKGVLYMPVAPEDGDEARMVMPSEGQTFFQALIQEGRRASYFDYLVDYAP
jgi:hypothetical protein